MKFQLRQFTPLLLLAMLLLGFGLASTGFGFWSGANLLLLTQQSAPLVVCALGMMLVLVAGGLDLSVGAVVALSSSAGAIAYRASHSPWLAVLAATGTGTIAGLVNGGFIAYLKLNPFIVTLGTMGLARGLNRLITEEKYVYLRQDAAGQALPGSWLDGLVATQQVVKTTAADGAVAVAVHQVFPLGLIAVYAVLLPALALLLHATVFGRQVQALGSNPQAARLCGVPVERTCLLVYAIAGLLFGLAGVVFLADLKSGHATAQLGYELDVIAAAVIGGASLSGGVGTMLGALAGALTIRVLYSGMVTLGVPPVWQTIAIGAIILVAALADQWRRRSG